MKRIRDTERPPAPPKELAPVFVEQSGKVHLASRRAPPFFVSETTLCGRDVAGLLAVGPAGCTCPKCVVLSKASA